MKKHFILFYFLLTIVSCTNQQEQKRPNAFMPKVVEAKGYVVSKDSMSEPMVIPIDERKLKKIIAGKPTVIPANTNIHPAGKPIVVLAGMPKIITPGQDTFSLPKTVVAIDSPFVAGIPKIVIAKDGYINDHNPGNFSSYGELQGLLDYIVCILQDKKGNLWFGAANGGAVKYDGRSFTHYTKNEGLSSNSVLTLLEDNNGNIWFGTRVGASKYNGKSFTTYSKKEGFSDNSVSSIIQDKSGNIWFGTSGESWFGTRCEGVSKYDGKSFTHYTMKEGLINNYVSSMLEDKKGNLWIGTMDGISKFDGKSFANYNAKEGLSNNYINSIIEDKIGNIWFGTQGGGVSKFNGKSFTNYTEKEGLSNNYIFSMLQDNMGNLWFCYNRGGVSKYDGNSFTSFTEKEGLSNDDVRSMLQDKNGNYWFGTFGGGVSKFNGKSFTHYTEKEGLSNNYILTFLEDKTGNLWLGSNGGVSKYNGNTFVNYTEKEGLSSNYLMSMLQDKSGNIWFGTSGGGVSKFDGKFFTHFTEEEGLSNNFICSMLQDKNGNLWFGSTNGYGTRNGGGLTEYDGRSFTRYTEKEGLSKNDVWSMLEDKSGNLWFGTRGGGASKYDGKSFTHFTEKEGLSNTVWAIKEDKSGNLWFGTSTGISKYDGKHFTHFTEKEGLINNIVLSIQEDKNGNLWFGTELGLSVLEIKNLELITKEPDLTLFKNYTYEDGFLGRSCNTNSICEVKNGDIWIGTNDRLTAYHPEGEVADTLGPNIQITSIDLFNENISWVDLENKKDTSLILGNGVSVGNLKFDGVSKWYLLPENLSLAYNNNFVTFHFIGITQKSPKKVKYQYKLEGIDEHQSSITYRNEATYGNLPQGNYTFKVKAMNGDGFWSNVYNYSFTIRPPWWKTWWAYSLYFFIITGSIWYYIKWREKALKDRQKELERTVTERTAEVVAQKERSEELLLNILPSEVAEELKQKGSAEAKQFDEVTVMFTDFKGFTHISEKLSPSELVAEIDTCFKAFDNIIGKHNIEKIKTIGDSYMCAGGLPVANKTNATDVINAALEIQQFMKEHQKQRIKEGKEVFEIRIGVNTGPVVAGIVGLKKFAYDIWGDTVNIASRMESSGEAGKVNISGSTYVLVNAKFNCIHRGKIEAKNKGLIDMYFVESEIE